MAFVGLKLTELTTVDLQDTAVSDTALNWLLSACGAVSLTHLNVSECLQLTDAALSAITTMCPKLRVLNASYNKQFTAAAFSALNESHQLQCLTEANLERVGGLHDTALTNLVKRSTALLDLNVIGNHRLTSASLEAVAASCSELRSLAITDNLKNAACVSIIAPRIEDRGT